jgi:hypothetical protein
VPQVENLVILILKRFGTWTKSPCIIKKGLRPDELPGNSSGICFPLPTHIRHQCYSWSRGLVTLIWSAIRTGRRNQPIRILNFRAVPAWATHATVFFNKYIRYRNHFARRILTSHFVNFHLQSSGGGAMVHLTSPVLSVGLILGICGE